MCLTYVVIFYVNILYHIVMTSIKLYQQMTVTDIEKCKLPVTRIRPWLLLAACLARNRWDGEV